MKNVLTIIGIFCLSSINAQNIGGFPIQDYLVSAINSECPNGNNSYVIGLPSDSSWVNFGAGGSLTGYFGQGYLNGEGMDLVLETSYHPSNYDVELILDDGTNSKVRDILDTEWEALQTNYFWNYVGQGSCSMDEWSGDRFMHPLDFETDFDLMSDDKVIGIIIVMKETVGSPDVAGIYITSSALPCPSVDLGPDSTICHDAIMILDAGDFNSYYWPIDGSVNQTFEFDANNFAIGIHEIEVETCDDNNCCTSDTVSIEVTLCSSLSQESILKEIHIWPNPFNSTITINVDSGFQIRNFRVFSANGQLVLKGALKTGKNTLVTEHLENGLYYIEIGGQVQKLVKTF